MASKNYWDEPKDPKDWTNSPQVKKWPVMTGDLEAKKKAAKKAALKRLAPAKRASMAKRSSGYNMGKIPASPTN